MEDSNRIWGEVEGILRNKGKGVGVRSLEVVKEEIEGWRRWEVLREELKVLREGDRR